MAEDFEVSTDWSGQFPDPEKPITTSTTVEERPHAAVVTAIAWPVLATMFLSLFMWGVFRVPDVQPPELVFPLLNAAEPFSMVRWESGSMRISPVAAGTLIAGFGLLVVGYTAARHIAPLTLGLAAVFTLGMAYLVLPVLKNLSTESIATLVFALIAIGLVFWGAARLPNTKKPGRFTVPGTLLAALLLTFYVPVAVGRLLAETDTSRLSLADPQLWWQYAVGASALVAVTCLISLIPPYKGRSVGTILVCLIVVAIFGFVYALPRA